MIYWISYKRFEDGQWIYCEEQFYKDGEQRMLKSLKKHHRSGWIINQFKIFDQKGQA